MDIWLFGFLLLSLSCECLQTANADVLGCGGFVKSFVTIDYSRVSLKLFTNSGNLKYTSDCAPNNGYYFIPIYDKGNYVLKIDPPTGWSFEPKEVALTIDGSANDICSNNKDVNFMFKGFTINGNIISNTLETGPGNVELTLIAKSNDNVLQSTKSTENGAFVFKEVLPGTYDIKASNNLYKFVGASSLTVTVNNDNVNLDSSLIVGGYNIFGRVESDGEPIKSVQFILYSKKNYGKDVASLSSCDKNQVHSKKAQEKDLTFVCHVVSGMDGKFMFDTISPGEYKIVPIYRGKDIQFEVKPEEVNVEIRHNHVEISPVFQVEGFSVTGKVLSSKSGKGIFDAQVLLTNGKGTVSEKIINTGKDGIFHLENIRTGTYTLQITASHILFETTTVKISPASPQIPDIIASAFEVCGKLVFTSSTSELRIGFQKIESTSEKLDQVVDVESDSRFCTFLRQGMYKVSPIIPEKLKKELIFVPKEKVIKVEDVPILDLEFVQFAAKLSGKIEHIVKKRPETDIIIKLAKRDSHDVVGEWSVEKQGFNFHFDSLTPGYYRVAVVKKDKSWCWEKDELNIEILDKDVNDVLFKQKGFNLIFLSSHAVHLNLQHPHNSKSEMVHITDSALTHCVSAPGVYKVTPVGCHKFSEDNTEEFTIDTESVGPKVLKLNAVKHLVTASVRTTVNLTDIVLTITTKPRGDNPELFSKITLQKFTEVKEGSTTIIEYPIEFWLPSFTTVDLKPISSQLLFKPAAYEVRMQDECLKNVVTFRGRTGLFVSGEIKPKLDEVAITIKDKKNGNVLLTTKTDSNGKYVGGPFDFDDGSELEVSAEKEGYLFQKLWSETNLKQLGFFEAQKLAGITVRVTNTDDKSNPQLKDVLISISGGSDNFRKNSVTPQSGQLTFVGLNPGQYFVRAVLKEFQFEPSSKILDVKQGETIVFEIKGKRVAFSCYGVTNSLNGQPEGGILVEAVGVDGVSQWGANCSQLLEEAGSESNGQFRIRDLQPNCKYMIRLKKDEKNEQISRSIPKEEIINIASGSEAKDITGIRLILFRKVTQMDISGIVHTKPEYWSSLKVKLYSEGNPEPPITAMPLTSAFFSLPSIAIDGRTYFIKLESTLSTSLYEFQTPIIYFQANRSFEHFDFTFNPRQRSSNVFGDHDSIQGGTVYTLPIILLLTILAYNYKTVLPFVSNFIENAQSFFAKNQNEETVDNTATNKKRVKPRRA